MGDLARNPAGPGAVEMPSAPPTNVRPFETWKEVYAVADAAGRFGPLVVFACATGLRPQEWQALEWQDVDVAGRHCRIRRPVGDGLVVSVAKTNGSLRRVSLQQRALDALAELPRPLDGPPPRLPGRGGRHRQPLEFPAARLDADPRCR